MYTTKKERKNILLDALQIKKNLVFLAIKHKNSLLQFILF